MILDRNLAALTAQLDNTLVVVSLSDTSAMALILTSNDDDLLADFRVPCHAVLTGDGLTTARAFHELVSEKNYVDTVHHKNTVRLNKVFMPEEEVVLERVSDRCDETLVWPM